MAIHSSTLVWRTPWTEEPGGLWFIGSQRVRHDWRQLSTHTYTYPFFSCARFSAAFSAPATLAGTGMYQELEV